MVKPHSTLLALAAAAYALASCAAGNPRTLSDQHVTYSYGDYYRVADGRDMNVVVRGAPFAMSQPDFDRLVTSNMARPGGPRTTYTTAKSANADPNYEIVWLFNGPTGIQPNELCSSAQTVQGRSGPADRLHAFAAFCRHDRANSWVEGWLDGGPQGVPREGFETLVAQMTRELFPVVPPNDPTRDHCTGPLC